jgi:hypothetical protein
VVGLAIARRLVLSRDHATVDLVPFALAHDDRGGGPVDEPQRSLDRVRAIEGTS